MKRSVTLLLGICVLTAATGCHCHSKHGGFRGFGAFGPRCGPGGSCEVPGQVGFAGPPPVAHYGHPAAASAQAHYGHPGAVSAHAHDGHPGVMSVQSHHHGHPPVVGAEVHGSAGAPIAVAPPEHFPAQPQTAAGTQLDSLPTY